MKQRSLILAATTLLISCGDQSGGDPVMRTEIGSGVAEEVAGDSSVTETAEAANVKSPCSRAEFQGVILTHCIADPARHTITMSLGPKGEYYRGFARLAGARSSTAAPVAFAVNGGMYDEAGAPIGYYVEDGERRRELNRADGPGNFHMAPNGVFYGTGKSWRVRTTNDFYASVSDRPRFGTQSGPMLLIDGELHPDFQADGPSKMIRNGVGVDDAGRAHFVKSEGVISFGQFASYFRDVAKTPNALYLDGNVSALWSPADDRMDTSVPLGPLIVVEERK